MKYNTNCGIYKITNVVNGKFYIGSSNNLKKRKREHFWSLDKGNHVNAHLQRAYDKYGKDSFEFDVLEFLNNDENLLEIEQFYIDTTDCCNLSVGYNINEYAVGGGLKGENNPNFGKKMSEEQKEKIRKTLLGHHVSETTKKLMSANRKGKMVGKDNHNFGKPRTKEQKERHSEMLKGRFLGDKNPAARKVVQLSKDGEFIKIHNTLKDGATEIGALSPNIVKCCKGIYNTTGGYKWMYLEEYEQTKSAD